MGDTPSARTSLRRIAKASHAVADAFPGNDDPLQAIARDLGEATGDACMLHLLTDDGALLRPAASHCHDEEILVALRAAMDVTQPADAGLWAAVVAHGEAVAYAVPPGTVSTEASPEQRVFIARYLPRHIVGMPMKARGRLLGIVALTRFRPEPFADEEIARIEALAERAALAVDNARLYRAVQQANVEADGRARRLERQAQRIGALHAVDVAIVASLALNTTLSLILDSVIANLEVDAARVLLHRPDDGTLEMIASRGLRNPAVAGAPAPLGGTAAGRAATERRMVVSASEDGTAAPDRDPRLDAEGFAIGYAVPLIARGQVCTTPPSKAGSMPWTFATTRWRDTVIA